MSKTGRCMFNNINLEAALRLYYERLELSCDDIRDIFGDMCPSTVTRLKNKARKQMVEDNSQVWNARNVNTASAFKAWGLDPAELEKRLTKLRKLGLAKKPEASRGETTL